MPRRIAAIGAVLTLGLLACGDDPANRDGAVGEAAAPVSEAPGWCGAPGRAPLAHPLVVIGVDGATWDVVDRMTEEGELPNFQSLIERGARSRIITLPPLSSPVAWTTYATGVFPRQHNILDFTYPYTAGDKSPVESTLRRRPALWNVASACRRRVGIVGYFVTQPAETVNGFMISDTLLGGHVGSSFPPDLGKNVVLIDSSAARQAAYRRFFPWGYDPRVRQDPEHPHYRAANLIFGRIDAGIIRDANVRRAVLEHFPLEVDLFMTYFRIVDFASHSAWIHYDETDFPAPAPAEEKALLEDVIPEAYRYIDDFLGEILPQLSPDTNLLILSDHGFGSATGAYAIDNPAYKDRLSGNHRFDGLLLGAGPDFRHIQTESVSMMDVTPLILRLLRLPLSRELPGSVPEALLSSSFLARDSPASVDSYDVQWDFVESLPANLESQKAALEQLKALGYIDPETGAGRSRMEEEADFWDIDINVRRLVLRGEILFYLLRDRHEKVAALMNLVFEHDPELRRTLAREVEIDAALVQAEFASPLLAEGVMQDFVERFSPKSTAPVPSGAGR